MLLLHASCVYSLLIRHYPGRHMCKLLSLLGFPRRRVHRAFVAAAAAAAFCPSVRWGPFRTAGDNSQRTGGTYQATLWGTILCPVGLHKWPGPLWTSLELYRTLHRGVTFPQGAPAPLHLLGLHPSLDLFWTCPERPLKDPTCSVPPREDWTLSSSAPSSPQDPVQLRVPSSPQDPVQLCPTSSPPGSREA